MRAALATAARFLRRVLPVAPGYSYFGSAKPAGGAWRDFHCQPARLDHLAAGLLQAGRSGADVYVALSGFTPEAPGRRKALALAQKSLWLDVDCGKPGAPYADAGQGLAALGRFCRETGLPYPLIVLSGRGLHCYWTLTQPIETEAWLPLAARLRELTLRHHFQVDPARTCDAASVLRLPGTFNYAGGGRRQPVLWFNPGQDMHPAALARLLYTAVPELSTPAAPVKTQAAPLPDSGPAGLLASQLRQTLQNFERTNRDPEPIVRGCAQVLGAGREAYPVWYAMMTILKYCRHGREAAHLISRSDRRYHPDTVNRKFTQAQESEGGPTRCDTFDYLNPGVCQGCPHRGRLSSPLEIRAEVKTPLPPAQAGTEEPAPEPVQLDGFSVLPGQGVVWHRKSDAGQVNSILINDNEIYITGLQQDQSTAQTKRRYKVQVRAPGRAPRTLLFDLDASYGDQNLMKWLGNNGLLPIKPAYNRAMGDFMGTYLGAMQSKLNAVEVRNAFGWTTVADPATGETEPAFVLSDGLYTAQGSQPVSLDARCRHLGQEFRSAGDLETWKHIPAMYKHLNQPEAQLFMCAAFAAPLMHFGVGTATNAILSIWDAWGGKGKSTLLRAVNSVWGHPEALMCGRNDTSSARFQVASARRNLPVCMDELTTMNEAEMSSLIYDLANGREKRKSQSSGAALVDTGSWETITFVSSNRSLHELMENYSAQSKAQAMRVIELDCNFSSYSGTEQGVYIERCIGLMSHHYGLAGPEFIKRCLALPDLAGRLARSVQAWDQGQRQDAAERFWTYSLALILEAGRLATEFGLLDYDIDKLDAWVRTALLPRLRGQIYKSDNTDLDVLISFMNDRLDQTLAVESAKRKRGKSDPLNPALDSYIRRMPARSLAVRLELDTMRVYINKKALSKWCADQHISTRALLAGLQRQKAWAYGQNISYRLGRGVSLLDRGATQCYWFDGNQLGLDDALPALCQKEDDYAESA